MLFDDDDDDDPGTTASPDDSTEADTSEDEQESDNFFEVYQFSDSTTGLSPGSGAGLIDPDLQGWDVAKNNPDDATGAGQANDPEQQQIISEDSQSATEGVRDADLQSAINELNQQNGGLPPPMEPADWAALLPNTPSERSSGDTPGASLRAGSAGDAPWDENGMQARAERDKAEAEAVVWISKETLEYYEGKLEEFAYRLLTGAGDIEAGLVVGILETTDTAGPELDERQPDVISRPLP